MDSAGAAVLGIVAEARDAPSIVRGYAQHGHSMQEIAATRLECTIPPSVGEFAHTEDCERQRRCVIAGPRTLARRSTELPVDDLSTLIGGWRTFLGGQVGQDQNGPRASSRVRWTALPRARTASGARLASQLACTRSGREGSPRELSITPA
jgi:hypothetical protein